MSNPLVALITAGSAGLGAATAKLFAQNGIRVVVNYSTNAERAEALVGELSRLSSLKPVEGRRDYHAIKADLAKRDDIRRMVDETASAMGRVDVVFSNGGWTHIRDFMDLDDNVLEEDWDHCFNMNVKSHLWLMHAVKPHLDATEGAFITSASMAGVKPSGSSFAYSVTKAAQIHLVKGLALIAAPKIRVNSVSPGLLMTVSRLQLPQDKINKDLLTAGDVGMGTELFARDDSESDEFVEAEQAGYCRGRRRPGSCLCEE